jgi:hypothetical protein
LIDELGFTLILIAKHLPYQEEKKKDFERKKIKNREEKRKSKTSLISLLE